MISTWILESSISLSPGPTTVSSLFQHKHPNKLLHRWNHNAIYQTTHHCSNLLWQVLILHQFKLHYRITVKLHIITVKLHQSKMQLHQVTVTLHRVTKQLHQVKVKLPSTNKNPFHYQNCICFIPNSVTYRLIPPSQFTISKLHVKPVIFL